MDKIKTIVLGIIGILLAIGIIGLALALGAIAFLIGASALVVVLGSLAIPASIKTIKNRKKRTKDFKSKCKEKGIKPDMKLYRDFQKEEIPFSTELGLNAALGLSKLSTDKKDIEIGKTTISKEELQDYSELYKEINSEIVQKQLSLQERLQRTIYALTKDDKETYFKTLEDVQKLTNIIIPGISYNNLGLDELYYAGDFEGKSKVVQRKSISYNSKKLSITKNGDIIEAFNPYTDTWQEYETITDLDQVYSLLKEKGIEELVNGIKTRGQR